MSTVEKRLAELVAIDSTSAKTNAPMVERLEKELISFGCSVSRQNYQDHSGIEKTNLIAKIGGSSRAELALVGHTDCVPFHAEWSDALKLTDRDGKLFGRGSCDTKGYISAAIEALSRTKSLIKKPLVLCFTADEEIGCVGAKKLLDAKALDAKRALIGEPTSLTPVRANKGYCLADIEIHGKEGHSAYPASGVSAVFRAAKFLSELEKYSEGELRSDVQAMFEPSFTTLNVGLMSAGVAKNVIAGKARMTLEWRPIPKQPTERVLNDVRGLLEKFESTLVPLRMDRGFETSKDVDLTQAMEKISQKESIAVSFGTEGPQLKALGAEPIVFGPGNIQVAHQTGEFVPKNELKTCVDMIEATIRRFCVE